MNKWAQIIERKWGEWVFNETHSRCKNTDTLAIVGILSHIMSEESPSSCDIIYRLLIERLGINLTQKILYRTDKSTFCGGISYYSAKFFLNVQDGGPCTVNVDEMFALSP